MRTIVRFLVMLSVLLSTALAATAAPSTLVLPGAAELPGAFGSRYSSTLFVKNAGTASTVLTIGLIPLGGGPSPTPVTQVINAGQSIAIPAVLKTLYGLQNNAGALTLTSDTPVLATIRTANVADPLATYGLTVDALKDSDLLSAGETGWSVWINNGAAYRTNVAVTLVAPNSSVDIRIFDATGALRGSSTVASATPLMSQVAVTAITGANIDLGYATFTVTAGSATGYTVINDNVTSDGTVFQTQRLGSGPTTKVLSGLAATAGLFGSNWKSDVVLLNPGTAPIDVTMTATTNQGVKTATRTFAAKTNTLYADILRGELFAFGEGAAGSAQFSASSPFLVGGKTYTAGPNGGTFSSQLTVRIPLQFLTAGSSGYFLGITQSAGAPGFRTNLALIGGSNGSVGRLILHDTTGAIVATVPYSMSPGQWGQRSVQDWFTGFSIPDTSNVELKVDSGSVDGYTSLVDNTTNDGSVFPLLPASECQTATVTLTLPTSACVGQTAKLSWRASDLSSLVKIPGVGDNLPSTGDFSFVVTLDRTFTASATNSCGTGPTTTQSITAVVTPSASATVTPSNIVLGNGVTLDISIVGEPTSFSVTDNGATIPFTLTQRTGNIVPTTTGDHVIDVVGTTACGTFSAQAFYTVTSACIDPAIPSFSVTPSRCGTGNVTVSWNTTGDGAVSISPLIGGVSDSGSVSVNISSTTTFTITKSATCNTAQRTATSTVYPVPSAVITAAASMCPNSTGNAASVPSAGAGASYGWSITNGTITSGSGTNAIQYSAGASGSVQLSVTVTNGNGCSANGTKSVVINPAADPTITAPASLTGGSTGNVASVPSAGAGASYGWSITNGTITSGAGTANIQFTAGANGNTTLNVTVTTAASCAASGSKVIPINCVPSSSAITAASAVCANTTGNGASVVNAGAGSTYTWTITGGVITSGAGTNAIQYTAGASGTVQLGITLVNPSGCTSSDTKTVTINPLPSATITAAASTCANSTGNAASVPSAGGGASYSWSITNGTITSGSGTAAIVYTAGASGTTSLNVTVTNASGCATTGSKSVTINPIPDPTITAPASLTGGSTGNVASVPSAGAGASYGWSITNGTITSGAGTANIQFTAGANGNTTLNVTVTTAASCAASGSKVIPINCVPSSSAITAASAVCANTTGNGASVVNAGAGSTYTWTITGGVITSGAGTNAIQYTAGASGTVQLGITLVNPSGCTSSDTKTVTINPLPSATITAAASTCANSTGNAASVPSAGGGASYSWSITNGTITSGSGTAAIVYTAGASGTTSLNVTVTNASGCSTSGSTSVTLNAAPSATLTAPNAVCPFSSGNTASVPNAGGGSTYSWSLTNGTITAGSTTNAITFTAGASGPALLSITVTNASGCSASNSKSITIDPAPNATMTIASSVCLGSTGNTASIPDNGVGAIYAWVLSSGAVITSGQGTRSIVYTAPSSGSNFVAHVDVNTAAGCATFNDVTVNLNTLPSATITAPPTACAGSTGNPAFVPSAGAGATYAWSITNGVITSGLGTTTVLFTAGASGSVTVDVVVTNSNGCSKSGTKSVTIQAPPDATVTAPAATCANSTGNAASVPDAGVGASYTWGITNGSITSGAGTRNIVFTAAASGPVGLTVTVTNSNGCSATGGSSTVVNPLPSGSISANPTTINGGQQSTLSITVANGTSWTLTSALGNTISPSGGSGSGSFTSTYSADANPGTDTVTLTITGPCGSSGPITTSIVVNP